MKYILLIMMLFTSCKEEPVEIEWFLGSWISHADLTIAENGHLLESEPEEIEAIRSILGEMRWDATSTELTVILPFAESQATYEYSVSKVTESEFQFSSESAGDMRIRRVGNSICADFLNLPTENPMLVSECFARYDT